MKKAFWIASFLSTSLLMACVNNMPVIKVRVTQNLSPSSLIHPEAASDIDSNRLLVHSQDIGALVERFGGNLHEINYALQTAIVEMTSVENIQLFMQQLMASDIVKSIEYDLRNRADAYIEENFSTKKIPSDPFYTRAVTLNGQSVNLNYGLQLVQAELAWEETLGSEDIVIAVLDSGIDTGHPEFQGRLVQGYDFVNNSTELIDDNGHGTHIAGIIAANMDNNEGLTGLAPRCKIMPIKILNSRMGGNFHDAAQGITWAVDNGAKVINLSLQARAGNLELLQAIQYALDHDVVVVAAMGNYGQSQAAYPAAYADQGLIAVGSVDPDLNRSSFSNFSPQMTLTAPGLSILSTLPRGMGTVSQQLGSADYGFKAGTSQSTPFVVGAAALLLSLNPSLKPFQIKHILEESSFDLSANQRNEFDFGKGMVNAHQAIQLLKGGIEIDPDLNNKPVIRNIAAKPYFIRPGDQVTLTVDVAANNPEQLGYGWASSAGQIQGQTQQVVWTAPNQPGVYQVVVGVGTETQQVYASTNILVAEVQS